MRFCLKFLFLVSLTTIFCGLTLAEPIRITTGNVTNGSVNISGNGISYDLRTTGGSTVFTFGIPYQPGSTISPGVNIFTGDGTNGYNVWRGGANINGVGFFGDFGGGYANPGSSNMIFNLTQNIDLPSIFPPPVGSGINVLSVNVPFTMTGYLVGRNCPLTGPCVDIPGQQVFGNGNATLNFAEFNGTYRLNTYNYSFSSTPEPTPEPATLLLMGTGLLGIVGYARNKRKKKSAE